MALSSSVSNIRTQARDDRNAVVGEITNDHPKCRKITGPAAITAHALHEVRVDLHQALADPVLGVEKSKFWRAPGDSGEWCRDAVLAIAAGAEHRIRITGRVSFDPRHVLPKLGHVVAQMRRTGERERDTQVTKGIRDAGLLLRIPFGPGELIHVLHIHGHRVTGRGHAHGAAPLNQLLVKLEAAIAHGAIVRQQMTCMKIDHLIGLKGLTHLGEVFHGVLYRRSFLTIEFSFIAITELKNRTSVA
jgi:hypothetical protein